MDRAAASGAAGRRFDSYFAYVDYEDDGCKYNMRRMWCDRHNMNCEQMPQKTCAGCGEKYRYAHVDCKAIHPQILRDGDTMTVTYSFDFAADGAAPGAIWFDTSSEKVYVMGQSQPIVIQDTFQRANGPAGNGGWYTTQTVLPNTESYEQRQELLRALKEDPSMASRGTKQFVATVDKKRLTTASAFDNAIDIGLLTDIRLEQRQDSTMGGPGMRTDVLGLPDGEWIHIIIKPTRPNDLGILAVRREGRFLQVHEVTSGARAKSEFPGVDRVVVLPA